VGGLVAGSVATLALEAITYGDMAVTGRPASSAPSDTAVRVAERLGIRLGEGSTDIAANRADGIGALMGHATGLVGGMLFGLTRPYVPTLSTTLTGVAGRERHDGGDQHGQRRRWHGRPSAGVESPRLDV
jgi:hypothetical protein